MGCTARMTFCMPRRATGLISKGARKLARRPLRLPAGASVLLCAGLTAAAVALALRFSDNVYLLADHTKFGKSGFIATCDVEQLDYVVTDEPVDDAWRKLFEKKKVQLLEGK